jgi:hypothetical protein
VVWLSWVDDLMVCRNKAAVTKAQQAMNKLFECDDFGEADEYVGCRVTRNEKSIKLTQPVLLQSYEDEFDLTQIRLPRMPAVPGTILHKGNNTVPHVGLALQTY